MSITRRKSALSNVSQRRISISAPVNLKALVRIYLLDGSMKVLQLFESSTAEDALIQLRFNMDLKDISTFALFRVMGNNMRVIDLSEKLSEVLIDPTESGQQIRILFRSWIVIRGGILERNIFQGHVKHHQSNTELWLAYMESTFMMMSGKYFLTEDEAVLLGCLKTQAESGDFNPEIHDTKIMKQKIASRFPPPIRDTMAFYLQFPKGRNIKLAEDLAGRVMQVYARLAGKSRVDSQIDFLQLLRSSCPFYGASFFNVQCQYDDTPLDRTRQPPITEIEVGIGPLAIFLITPGNPPTIIRHAYNRIVKWIAHPEKHIFAYWVVKSSVRMEDLEDAMAERQGLSAADCNPFCDCVYLVSPHAAEIEHIVRSYVNYENKDVVPCLPQAPIELQQPTTELGFGDGAMSNAGDMDEDDDEEDEEADDSSNNRNTTNENSSTPSRPKSKGRFSVFFKSLSGYGDDAEIVGASPDPNKSGSGWNPKALKKQVYRDEVAGVNNSVFKDIYHDPSKPITEEDLVQSLPSNVKYAASMSELKKVAEEEAFSDDENDENMAADAESEQEDNSSEDESKPPPPAAKTSKSWLSWS